MNRRKFIRVLGYIILVALIMYGLNRVLFHLSYEKIEYSKFEEIALQGKVNRVKISDDKIYIYRGEKSGEKKGRKVLYTKRIPLSGEDIIEQMRKYNISEYEGYENEGDTLLEFAAVWIIPIVIFGILGKIILEGVDKKVHGEALDFGKSNAKIYADKDMSVKFSDVAGQDEAKESLKEVVAFLNEPERFKRIGADIPKGVLLEGPPGTGKTLLARAVAGEGNVPFFSMSGSEFVQMFVGLGAAKVRDLFKEAQKKAPCIVFIDEIDAIGKSRTGTSNDGNDEREQTLNQLLTEMDGFDSKMGVVIIAATNRPEVLDKALLRAGRFDRRVIMDVPDRRDRSRILKVHMRKVKSDGSIDLDRIAKMTSGAVGADLANIINEGALCALRKGRETVNESDLEYAVEEVFFGKVKKEKILSQEEKIRKGYHEIGHGVAAAVLKSTKCPYKISIIPRVKKGEGFLKRHRISSKRVYTYQELKEMVIMLLGGRAAEEVMMGICSTASEEDIKEATEIVRSMVTRYGMSESFDMTHLESREGEYLEGDILKLCSDRTEYEVDRVVVEMIKAYHKKALLIMEEHKKVIRELCERVVEKETLSREEFLRFLELSRD